MPQLKNLVFVLFVTVARSQSGPEAEVVADTLAEARLPQFDGTADESESGAGQQEISGLLQGSRDIFVQFASFQFGQGGFRIRGFESDQHLVLVNGINLSDPETGRSSWSAWGGLNEVTRLVETRTGQTPCNYAFAPAGGYSNILASAGYFKRLSRVHYTHSGRVFNHRLMLTHSSGLSRSGWAFTGSASIRFGNEVVVPGTYFSSASFFVSAYRRLNRRHALSVTTFAAPVEQGRQNALQRETYLLTGDPYYNSAWGIQNGKVRNSSVGRSFLPTAMASHQLVQGETFVIVTTISYQHGRTGNTGLNYAESANPRPDYYRYLPSSAFASGDTANGKLLEAAWREDPETRQINWDGLIALNRSNIFTLPGDSSSPVNTTETRAMYLLENRVKVRSLLLLNSAFRKQASKTIWSGGICGKVHRSRNYKIAEDLLGASFWLDIDPFAPNSADDITRHNDLAKPDLKVRTGERFGYDYSIHVARAEAWTQLERRGRLIDVFLSGEISWQQVFRNGHVANGKFPGESKGRSGTSVMPGAGARSGATIKISGRQYLTAVISYILKQPSPSDLFVSPTVRNQMISDPSPEEHTGADLTYHVHVPGARLRATVYHASLKNQCWTRTFWHDSYNATINLIMRKVHVDHQGIEFGLEKSAGQHLFQGAAGYASAVYRGRPDLEAWQDNNSANLYSNRPAYLNNYRSNSSPQLAFGLCYRFSGQRSWFVSAAISRFSQIYTNVDPQRRTAAATAKYSQDESELAMKIVAQENIEPWWLTNIGAYKAFRLRNRSVIGCSIHVNNLLNERTIYTGFEQLRWDASNPDLFEPKYFFSPPRTILMSITFNI